ncbi:MAG: chemotaxis protein CheX [Bryobacteraceae bacterium]|nr:chemotaxis protein CheX [Bryobacteraceae bacterium]
MCSAERAGQVLDQSVSEVLETMCFAFPEGPLDAALAPVGEDAIDAEIRFCGHAAGAFHLRVGPQAAWELASSFLGTDAGELEEGRMVDAVREIANMICGSALSALEADQSFELSEPSATAGEFSGLGHCYALEQGYVEAVLELEPAEVA